MLFYYFKNSKKTICESDSQKYYPRSEDGFIVNVTNLSLVQALSPGKNSLSIFLKSQRFR